MYLSLNIKNQKIILLIFIRLKAAVMNNVKNENLPIQIPKQEKTNMKIINLEGTNNNCIDISQLRSFIDNENKMDDNKMTINEPNINLEANIINENSYNNNACQNQATNNNFSMNNKSNSKIQEESAETKSLFYVELRDYIFSKIFKRKSLQLVKYQGFKTVIKDILSIELILEAINDISQLKNKLQVGTAKGINFLS